MRVGCHIITAKGKNEVEIIVAYPHEKEEKRGSSNKYSHSLQSCQTSVWE